MPSLKKIIVSKSSAYSVYRNDNLSFKVKKGEDVWEEFSGYTVYEIPLNKDISFELEADETSTRNVKATEERIFIVKQKVGDFKTNKWLPFSANKKDLHTYINDLSKQQIESGSFNPLTAQGTKEVGTNYLKGFEYKHGEVVSLPTSFKLTSGQIGKGFWVEAFNYFPEWVKKEQGVFVIGVDAVQIINFYAEQRVKKEKDITSVTQQSIASIPQELAYGDILDLHISIHTQNKDFDCILTIKDDKDTIVYTEIFGERNYINTPQSLYNLYTIKEISLLPQWISEIDHEEGTVRNFTITLEIVPPEGVEARNTKKEITFKINYKDEWAIDEQEQEWVPQIAEIQEATLVTQEFEECGFTGIKISDSCGEFYILKQAEDGSLEQNSNTPILEYVAGSTTNTQTITIDLEEVETSECQQAGFDNASSSSKSHKDNVFDTLQLPVEPITSELFGSITPATIKNQTDNQLKVELAFPYQADSKAGIFSNYLFGGKHIEFPVLIQSCRYIRTPIIKLYADIEWILKLKVAATQPATYSHTNMTGSQEGERFNQHQKKAITAGQNKKWLNKEVSFELSLNAKYNGGEETPVISASYENKIRSILNTLVKIKETIDSICHVDKVKAGGLADKLAGKLKKLPIIIIIDYPAIEIEGSWKYEQQTNGVVARTGSISLGFSPLIKGTGKIDLIVCAGYIPVIGQIIRAADLVIAVAGGEVWFNLYAFGSIGFKGTIYFNQEKAFDLQSDTILGVGAELGVKAEVSTKALSFRAERTESAIGAELSAKGETSFTFTGKAGLDGGGTFLEAGIEFNGVDLSVTAKVKIGWFGGGVEDKIFNLVEKPADPILSKKFYILEK